MKTIKSYDEGFESFRKYITLDDYLQNKEIYDKHEFLPLEGTLEKSIEKRTFTEDKEVLKITSETIFYCEKLDRFMTSENYKIVKGK